MEELNRRFFTAIEYEEYERIGLSLLSYRKIDDVWHYELLKKDAWRYSDYEAFSYALQKIDYNFKIVYAYTNRPLLEGAIKLFREWLEKTTPFPLTVTILGKGTDVIEFMFEDEEGFTKGEQYVRDFALLLQELSYPFSVKTLVLDQEEEDPFTLGVSSKGDSFISEEEGDEEDESSEEDETLLSQQIYETHEEELLANFEKMVKERENAKKKKSFVPTHVRDIKEPGMIVDFDGMIFSVEKRTTKSGELFILGVGKDEDAIMCRAFVKDEKGKLGQKLFALEGVKGEGKYVRIRGESQIEKFNGELIVSIKFFDLLPDPFLPEDNYEGDKRIEFHLHTKMSMMDGVSTMDEYVSLAASMGHKAIALTDHGVVQAYPEAQKAGKKYGVKIIYGAELYLIDTKLKYITNGAPILLSQASYVVFDFETTGLSARYDRIIEFGAVKVEHGMITKRIDLLINPGKGFVISDKISKITKITNEMVKNEKEIEDVIDEIMAFVGDSILVSHNAEFDLGFFNATLERLGRPKLTNPTVDTLMLSRYLFPEARAHRLGALARNLEVFYDELSAHRADYDAQVLNDIWQAMIVRLTENAPNLRHVDLDNLQISNAGLTHLRPEHVTVYAKNEKGLKDLFKLISKSHIHYFANVAKVPRIELDGLRENLLVGSACFNGEVFKTATNKSEEELLRVINYYDFIELQPYSNYEYLINSGELSDKKQLITIVSDIYNASKKAGKKVLATGDAHYALPEKKIVRDVFISAKGVGNVPHPLYPYDRDKLAPFENPDQHYRSTGEMIEEFKKFGIFNDEEIKDMVVTNPHYINCLIDVVKPIKEGLFKPNIEDVDKKLTTLVYENARSIYGEDLPKIIVDRIESELHGIIHNGFAVIYYLAHQIVKKANDDGYIVGSRGSVGSSIIASFAKISEVNPLPPHYVCPACKHSIFEHGESAKSGYDLPPKKCPKCHTLMKSDGQNIPFATFIGFDAEKVPDIDLNFPDDYQKQAHDYTKVLFGENNVFRAGTISTVAFKTAFGYVRGYFERLGYEVDKVPRNKIAYLSKRCIDVKRTTGQHPGGIIVIPRGYDVEDFTPIQYPADKSDSEWYTTHLDYNAIHDNVLKLDLLGHRDPVALGVLTKLTGIAFDDVPLNDKKVISLFSSVENLGLANNLLKEDTGALGLPEFGTPFVRKMLATAKPQSFNDLVIISGLSHGTGVWRFNAENLIADKVAKLDEVIGCRDDIMTYLASMGMAERDAFSIMESVRKGKGIKGDTLDKMRAYNIPEYYIESCNKIEYLFPRAHATAYVTMAVKVAWFKLYKPLAHYATFFTIRGANFDLKTMIGTKEEMLERLHSLDEERRKQALNSRDENIYENIQVTLEMFDRGFKIANIDLYKSLASSFVIDEENKALIPPFTVLSGLGEAAAQSVVEARSKETFLSIEDLVSKTKLNSQNIERLKEIGALNDLPEDNQISLFEFLD